MELTLQNPALIAAKTSTGLAVAAAVGSYATVILLAFWQPAGLWAIAAAFIRARNPAQPPP